MGYPLSFTLTFLFLQLLSGFCKASYCGSPPRTISVSQYSGQAATFKTIQSAIDSVPSKNSRWIRIRISRGTYNEMVTILPEKPCIYLEGAGDRYTTIESRTFSDQSWNGTFNSLARDFVAKGITFKNSYNLKIGNHMRPAFAAKIEGDRSAFFNCSFVGLQDTLNDASGRHYFYGSYFEGGVDFIFGDGQSIYEKSRITYSLGPFSSSGYIGFITAQGRETKEETSGFVFKECVIDGEGKAYLGRAYGAYSRVIIANSILTDVVDPLGWSAWNYTGHEGQITYVEEGCKGKGADKSKRVAWLKELGRFQLQQFLDISYIDKEGWIGKLPGSV